MSTIQSIDHIIGEYKALANRLIELSHQKIKAQKNYNPHMIRYLGLDGFYVEDGKVHVEFSYAEPYSGSETCTFTAEEVSI